MAIHMAKVRSRGLERRKQSGRQSEQNAVAVQRRIQGSRTLQQHLKTDALGALRFQQARLLDRRSQLVGQRQERCRLLALDRSTAGEIVDRDHAGHAVAGSQCHDEVMRGMAVE